jgi:hypothetical protein
MRAKKVIIPNKENLLPIFLPPLLMDLGKLPFPLEKANAECGIRTKPAGAQFDFHTSDINGQSENLPATGRRAPPPQNEVFGNCLAL